MFIIKVFCIAFVLSGVNCNENLGTQNLIENQYIFEETINATLEAIKEQLQDEFALGSASVEVDVDQILTGTLRYSDVVIRNLTNFIAEEINFDLLSTTLDLSLRFDGVSVEGGHWADAVLIQFIPMMNDGIFRVQMDALNINIHTKISLIGGKINDLLITPSLDFVDVKITGIMGDEEFSEAVSKTISMNLPELINDNRDAIARLISPYIQDLINSLLSFEE